MDHIPTAKFMNEDQIEMMSSLSTLEVKVELVLKNHCLRQEVLQNHSDICYQVKEHRCWAGK